MKQMAQRFVMLNVMKPPVHVETVRPRIGAAMDSFDSTLLKFIPRTSQPEPAVYHAVVAFSAIREDYVTKEMPLPIHESHSSWQEFALRSFRPLFFVLLDLVQGQYDDAFSHLQSGLRILLKSEAHRQLLAPTLQEEVVEQSLVAVFAHLDILSSHYGIGGSLSRIHTELTYDEFKFDLFEYPRNDPQF
ncbi:hypothetical protein BBP40_011349 [Aspergillus hancockii]|nr:hypothetical protein BBP40_011349 [Aspergillus hancockii]